MTRETEIDNEDAQMNHILNLWKSDVIDAENVTRRTQRSIKLTQMGFYYRLNQLRAVNCRGSKVRMEERAIEENIRLAEVITKSIYADQKLKMEYNRKLEMEEKVAKRKSRAKILGTLGDIPLQKYQKEGPLLTEEDNSKNK